MPHLPKGFIGGVYCEARLTDFRRFKLLSCIPYFISNMVKIHLVIKKLV